MRATLRKVGGSTMIALPPSVLDALGLKTGATIDIVAEGDRVVLRPVARRPILADLLARCDPTAPDDGDAWTHETAIGDEVI